MTTPLQGRCYRRLRGRRVPHCRNGETDEYQCRPTHCRHQECCRTDEAVQERCCRKSTEETPHKRLSSQRNLCVHALPSRVGSRDIRNVFSRCESYARVDDQELRSLDDLHFPPAG